MKLFITKSQPKGLMGRVKFEFKARVELTPEESELVGQYRTNKELLLKKEIKIPLTGRSLMVNITIESLMRGEAFKCNNIAEILEYEEMVKEGCKIFKNYIEVMKSFGGEEVIEYK